MRTGRVCLGAGLAALALLLPACKRQAATPRDVAGDPTPVPEVAAADGAALYMQHCATCHMADGGGVPNFQPSILDSAVLAAEPIRLETVIRAGSAALRDRPNPMGWEMPPFGFLTDPEIKALVSYVREQFGPNGVASAP